MADRVCALCFCDLNDPLCDNRTRKGGAEQIFALINSACLDGGEHIFLNEFLVQIFDVQLGSAGCDRLFLQTVKLGALTDVAGNRDDLAAVIVFLEPRDNN